MIVPKGKTIWIGNKRYKAGDELPASYSLPEKKKISQPVKIEKQGTEEK